MGPPRRSVPLFSFERKEKRKNIISNRLVVYFFLYFSQFSPCRHITSNIWCVASAMVPPSWVHFTPSSQPSIGAGGMPAVVPPASRRRRRYYTLQCRQCRTAVCLSVVQELHYTTLHNTALHYTMVFSYNQVFVDQSADGQTRGHTDWFFKQWAFMGLQLSPWLDPSGKLTFGSKNTG